MSGLWEAILAGGVLALAFMAKRRYARPGRVVLVRKDDRWRVYMPNDVMPLKIAKLVVKKRAGRTKLTVATSFGRRTVRTWAVFSGNMGQMRNVPPSVARIYSKYTKKRSKR